MVIVWINVIKGFFQFQVDSIDFNYNTPLQLASKRKKLKVVQELLTHDANISQVNKFGETVWDTAIRDKENFLFSLLVANCVDRSIPMKSNREPLLHIAAKCGDLQKLEKLFELGLDSDDRDSSGNTLYHIAARFDSLDFRDFSKFENFQANWQ